MPLARRASCTRRQGCTRGPPSSPWQTYKVGFSAIEGPDYPREALVQRRLAAAGSVPPASNEASEGDQADQDDDDSEDQAPEERDDDPDDDQDAADRDPANSTAASASFW